MADRPQGRKHGPADSSGGVHKRGEGLHTGKVGNADYGGRNGRNNGPSRSSGSDDAVDDLLKVAAAAGAVHAAGKMLSGNRGGGKRKKGGFGKFLLIIIVVLLALFFLGTCDTEDTGEYSYEETPVSEVTYSSGSGHSWSAPATTYVNASTASVNNSVSSGARDKYTVLKGNGEDQVTMLVYMCGTDLESKYGMATSDLTEMAYAQHSDKVNIVVETGGCRKWKNSSISSRTNQRWLVTDNALQSLDDNVGSAQMTDPDTLEDFISWGAKAYPANRYILVLWDHGGGSLTGYGYDELYPNGSMTVDEIASAVKNSGVKFDFIGFDACLMANAETAVAMEPYADYLIASEETEPGTSWYYTDWLTTLAENSSTPTVNLGKQIVDGFINASAENSSRDKTSLSVVDLAEFDALVPEKLSAFAKQIRNDIDSDEYQSVADARSVTKEFAESSYIDQIDLVHFCKNMNTSESNALAEAVQECVKYNRCNNMTNAYGLSIYFPYNDTKSVSTALSVYNNINMDGSYAEAIRSFATLEASGQIVTNNSSGSLFDLLSGGSQSSQEEYSYEPSDLLNLLLSSGSGYYDNSGYSGSYGSPSLFDLLGGEYTDDESMDDYCSYFGRNHIASNNLVFSEKNGRKVLSLSEAEWKLVHDIELNVWADDGTGYIDLGLDNIYSFNDDGDLVADYDRTWVSINQHVVSYYFTAYEEDENGNGIYSGYVPAMLNGEKVRILLQFDMDGNGTVLGVQKVYDDGTAPRGYEEVDDGDVIDFLCDYYDYDGNYQDTYYLGDPLTVDGDLSVGTYQIDEGRLLYGYRLSNIYNGYQWTDMLEG